MEDPDLFDKGSAHPNFPRINIKYVCQINEELCLVWGANRVICTSILTENTSRLSYDCLPDVGIVSWEK